MKMSKKTKPKKITSGVEILRRRYVKRNPAKEKIVQNELANLNIAKQIYDLRKKAGLKQSELAALIGTSPSVISRLEDAAYEGHSLTILKRIAIALGKTIEVRILDNKRILRDIGNIEFEPPRLTGELYRPADFS